MTEKITPNQKKIKQPQRKGLTQCQHCYKSRLDGVELSKCKGCGMALYCNKDCQKAGWPLHKETCKINQRRFDMRPDQTESLEILRAFTAKHRPTIANCGVLAFDLCLNTTRGLDDTLVLTLQPRPGSKRAETAFIVTDAYTRAVNSFGHQSEQLRGQLKHFHEENIRAGLVGGITVMLLDTSSGVSNIAPVGFPQDVVYMPPGQPWKEELMFKINNGKVY